MFTSIVSQALKTKTAASWDLIAFNVLKQKGSSIEAFEPLHFARFYVKLDVVSRDRFIPIGNVYKQLTEVLDLSPMRSDSTKP